MLSATEARLRSLLAWPTGSELSFVDDLDRPAWRCDADSLMALALTLRADLARVAAEESLRVAQLTLERRLGRVNPTLGASVSRENSSFDQRDFSGRPDVVAGLDGLGKTETRWGLSLALPLPLSYRRQPEIAQAAVEKERAAAERRALVVRLRAEVAAASASVAALQARVSSLEEPSRGATADLGRVELAYRDGRISLQEYLTFRERLIDEIGRASCRERV